MADRASSQLHAAAGPHAGEPVLRRGPDAAQARLAVILVHGRGDSAAGILGLADELHLPDIIWIAPQAAGNTWYPHSFLSPMAENEPGLSSGLSVIGSLVQLLMAEGIAPDGIVLMGFSQGACLSQEFAARNARRYHSVVGLSGGLIGPAGTPRDYAGAFSGTPVFLGCSDMDPHIPLARVQESAAVFRRMGAVVDERIYPRMGHTVNADEIAAISKLLTLEA
ncbi:MAG: phospholipase [Vicinamibacterales bacterium]